MKAELQYEVEQFFYHMSSLCDSQAWDEYINLFTEDSEFHLPQWDAEHVYTTDPRKAMSLIYYSNRGGLEDRVFRIRTGKAASTVPMPRTLHMVSNIQVHSLSLDELEVKLNWATFYHRLQVSEHFFGKAEYRLCRVAGEWKIRRKFALLLNDTINSVLDFYHI